MKSLAGSEQGRDTGRVNQSEGSGQGAEEGRREWDKSVYGRKFCFQRKAGESGTSLCVAGSSVLSK